MEEHEHHHKIILEETEGVKDPKKENQNPSLNVIAGSILAGALIIAGSILYATRDMSKILSSTQSGQSAIAAAQQQAQNPGQQAPSGPVSITDRADEPV